MSSKSLAQSAHQSTTEVRLDRGRQLFTERWDEIEHISGDFWTVPSGNLLTGTYTVKLGYDPRCGCKDHYFRGSFCYHLVAASIMASKSRSCDCCGRRVPGRFLSTVEEDDNLLSWFIGDALCADCIRAGYWS
jgi:hypothetical protein